MKSYGRRSTTFRVIFFDFSGRLRQLSVSFNSLNDDQVTIFNILGEPNGISDLKNGFDNTFKNTLVVSQDLLRIVWKL